MNADVDWPQIGSLYDRRARMVQTALGLLNPAVAVALADGPAAATPLVEQLAAHEELGGYTCCPPPGATWFSAGCGRADASAVADREALSLAPMEAEERFRPLRRCKSKRL